MAVALALAAVSGGLDFLSGVMGYFDSQEVARIAESRGRMVRLESDTEAQRYAEQARDFQATQKLAYIKSGVKLTGSPLDILDETARVAAERISAIRAKGAAGQLAYDTEAGQIRNAGRSALLSGITGGLAKTGQAAYLSGRTADIPTDNRKNTATGFSAGRTGFAQQFLSGEGF